MAAGAGMMVGAGAAAVAGAVALVGAVVSVVARGAPTIVMRYNLSLFEKLSYMLNICLQEPTCLLLICAVLAPLYLSA